MAAPTIAPGTRIGNWTVVGPAEPSRRRQRRWLCECDCGTRKALFQDNLTRRNTSKCLICHNKGFIKHGMYKSVEYRSWRNMINRCTRPDNRYFHHYGGRGITIDPDWMDFRNFIRDMGPQPPSHTIERIDNDGPYAPWNCRWATRREQQNNRRTNRIIEFGGRRATITQWAASLGVTPPTLHYRLASPRWSLELALTTPAIPRNKRRSPFIGQLP
jgi:hypothetical protein